MLSQATTPVVILCHIAYLNMTKFAGHQLTRPDEACCDSLSLIHLVQGLLQSEPFSLGARAVTD